MRPGHQELFHCVANARHEQRDQRPASTPPEPRKIRLGQKDQGGIEDRHHDDYAPDIPEFLPKRTSPIVVTEAAEEDQAGDAERQRDHRTRRAVISLPAEQGFLEGKPVDHPVGGAADGEASIDDQKVETSQKPCFLEPLTRLGLDLCTMGGRQVHQS